MSPHLAVLIAQGEVCRALRSKTLLYQVEDPADHDGLRHTEHAAPDGPFWCVRTQSVLGPDGGVAEVDHCRPGRGCCETA